jgi:2-hydroxy-6-oxonona-2,4-dienedioate hydrolase
MLTKFIDVDGVSTRCLVAGDEKAPPLLLIHGVSLTAEIWQRNMDELGCDYYVVAPDMLGHGFSKPRDGAGPVTIPAKIKHLLGLANSLKFDKFSISGSSYGGLIGCNLYLANKDRVNKLIINGSGSCFNTEAQLGEFMARIYQNYRPTLTTSTSEMWRERLKSTFYDPASIPRELLTILPLCYAQPWALASWEATIGTMRDLAEFRPFRILERLEEFDIETLVVWGREDRGGIYESAVAAVERMPNAELISFDKCGHLPMLEHPELYNRTVREFLNRPKDQKGAARQRRAQ